MTITLVAERRLLFALWKVRGLLFALVNERDVGVEAVLAGTAAGKSVSLAIGVARVGRSSLANAAPKATLAFVAADCVSGVIVRIPPACRFGGAGKPSTLTTRELVDLSSSVSLPYTTQLGDEALLS